MLYIDIVNTALSFSDRQDSEVSNAIPTMISSIIEPQINRFLQIKKSSARATTVGQGLGIYYYDLPIDFMELRNIKVWTSNTDPTIPASILYVPTMCSPEQIDWLLNKNSVNFMGYAIEGNQFKLWPAVVAPAYIEILYYKMVPPLTIANNTNWISQYYPDVYIFGLLAEINAFVKDFEAFSAWNTRFQNSLNSIKDQDENATWSGISLQTKVG